MANNWWVILIAVLLIALGIGLGIFFILRSYSNSKKEFNELIDPILKDLEVVGYGTIKAEYLNSLFKPKELEENKFLTRPFMVLSSPYLFTKTVYILIPQFTNHKSKKFPNNLYLANDTKYINVEQTMFVYFKDVNMVNQNEWVMHKNNVHETNRNIEIVKNIIKHTLWITRGGSEIRGQHLVISETLRKCGLEKEKK